MTTSWKSELLSELKKNVNSQKAESLFEKYQNSFSASYENDVTTQNAVKDIMMCEQLSSENSILIEFYQIPEKNEKSLRLRLYQFNKSIPLSDIIPIFENMDLRTFSGRPYDLFLSQDRIWISEFTVSYSRNTSLDIEKLKPNFQEAFIEICKGIAENDGFNKLILGANLSSREVTIIRAYAKYLHQTRFRFSQPYIEKTIANYPEIATDLIYLFKLKHDPKQIKRDDSAILALQEKIKKSLDAITSLDDDRIMRRLLLLMNATLRTNYFQMVEGRSKDYLSFKFKSDDVPELPLPHPLYEIFVYSPRFEGIHLRSAKVARGGIRWSDRREDFRTEILGLMKAQKVKNAVIVPSGAKGGFVLKADLLNPARDVLQAEVIFCYKSFIRGLLDLTDNFHIDKIARPPDVVCYDDEDPYLVVAADKGTATFSDIANSISEEYKFWLGDAFASGGKTGYDHKKMGITARGAWESVRRHFRELNINVDETPITTIGIGDMSGDVFGNGMIYLPTIKLIAAFDHRNIFLDPNPDPKVSFTERKRLFNLPNSSWEDYDPKLISKGGGVFKRSLKSITLTHEIKQILAIEDNTLTPNELIRAILKAPVDLFFNGGIGTYVKATTESHAEVGDKTNEFCRVNGNELRCRVVGEGGNLGFTQLGRIEYALQGGLINTDFIDNSAGVDCSDHEVNIKILLNNAVRKNKLNETSRNELLAQMTDQVAKLVLKDNYSQALAMSFSSMHANKYIGLYHAYLKDLEALAVLDRAVEFLPTDKTILDRKAAGLGFTRPETAVLLAYTKIYIKHEILKSDLPEEPYFAKIVNDEFPQEIIEKYGSLMKEHRLYREIIATQLSNYIVNEMGITFVYRVQTETGATVAEIIRAHAISAAIYDSHDLEKLIDSLGAKITIQLQYELLHYIRGLLNLSTRWFLRSHHLKADIGKTIEHFSVRIKKLKDLIPTLMLGKTKDYLEVLSEHFIKSGINKDVAHDIAVYRALYISLNVIEISTQNQLDLIETAKLYFAVGGRFNLVWFRDQISSDSREGHWNTMARLSLRDELDLLQKLITVTIIKDSKEKDPEKKINSWVARHHREVNRWEQLLQLLHSNPSIDYTMFFVALRELSGWLQARSEHWGHD